MKNVTLFLIGMLFISSVFGQIKSNLVFFTEQGERFHLILNGINQNQNPETNVKITDLISPSYKVKVIFENTNLGEIDKNKIFNQGTETTFVIKKNRKGEYVIRWMNEVPIAQAPAIIEGQSVIIYNTQPQPQPTTTIVTNSQTTTVNQGVNMNPSGASMNVNFNNSQSGANINMNINAGGNNTTTSSTTITKTEIYQNPQMQQTQTTYVLPGYNGPVGCPYPMSSQDFTQVKYSISSKDFEDSKLRIAKQVIMSNCLLSSQVKEIMLLFDFEDTRLKLAKFAYGYTYDIGNYYLLNDAFDFESTIEELNDYIYNFGE
ncbi:MAG: DUF4476 domain-containing protein [Bacteroidota bacterium]|nr:DUF4476 domain-containing protein [Bacteroidota bacterium]